MPGMSAFTRLAWNDSDINHNTLGEGPGRSPPSFKRFFHRICPLRRRQLV